MEIENITFGVEVEFAGAMLGSTATRMQAYINQHFNGRYNVQYEGYNHRVTTSGTWKLVRDGSVTRGTEQGGELVSPVLKGAQGFQELKDMLEALNSIPEVFIPVGAARNPNEPYYCETGLHIHLSWDGINTASVKNIVKRFARLERYFDAAVASSRHNSRWCGSVRSNPSFLQDVAQATGAVNHAFNYCGGRYQKINLQSLSRYKTIEFRQHQGSTDYDKIRNWILFLMQFVKQSVDGRATGHVMVADDYRGHGPQRAYREIRELLEVHRYTLEHGSRGTWWVKDRDGEIVTRTTNDELLSFYATGAVNPNTGTRTRQRGATFNTTFFPWFEAITGTANDTILTGIAQEQANWYRGRVASFNHFRDLNLPQAA
jgi:hypothetical protein